MNGTVNGTVHGTVNGPTAVAPADHLADLADAVDALLAQHDLADWRAVHTSLAAAGFAHLSLPEVDGGDGGTLADAATVLRRCGYAGLRAPLVESQLAEWLVGRALDGVSACGVVTADTQTRLRWAGAAERCVVLVDGSPPLAAEVSGAPTDDVTLAGEPIGVVTAGAGVTTVVTAHELRLRGALLRAPMLLGAAERALDSAVRYAGERDQFGRPLRAFQAVGHLLAECAGEIVTTTTTLDAALAAADAPDCPPERRRVAAIAAVVQAGAMAGRVAAATHQVHGAIGFTEEHPLHISTRALWSWRDDLGTEHTWARELGRLAVTHGRGLWDLLAD